MDHKPEIERRSAAIEMPVALQVARKPSSTEHPLAGVSDQAARCVQGTRNPRLRTSIREHRFSSGTVVRPSRHMLPESGHPEPSSSPSHPELLAVHRATADITGKASGRPEPVTHPTTIAPPPSPTQSQEPPPSSPATSPQEPSTHPHTHRTPPSRQQPVQGAQRPVVCRCEATTHRTGRATRTQDHRHRPEP